MELIERTDLRATYYLASLHKSVATEIFKRRKDGDSIDAKYNRLQNFIKEVIKSNGVVSRTYTYAHGTVPEFGGRLFSGNGIQGQPREFRGLLMKHTTDIDMKNAHPTILRYLCAQRGIRCPQLNDYVADRDNILATFSDREKAKALFLASINDNKLKRSEHHNKQFKRFDEEMKDIQNAFYAMEEFALIRQSIPSDKASNPQGSMINRIMCSWENKILQVAIDVAKRNDLEIAVLAFDGFMPYGDHYGNTDLLQQLNDACEESFPGLKISWSYKSHDATLTIPEDFTIPENTEEKLAMIASEQRKTNQEEIRSRVCEFEKTHAKIINADLYVIEQHDVTNKPVVFKTREKLQNAYSHLAHVKPDPSKSASVPFITFWATDNPEIRAYRDMDTFPNPDMCPSDMYNLWTPFLGERLPEAPENYNGVVDFIDDHLLTLSGLCENTKKYMTCWFAQMIQYPEVKTNCPVLISNEGAGKGQTMNIFKNMLGDQKVYECTNPARDILGSFNGRMSHGFLVNINEAKRKDTTDGMGQFYSLITDKKVTINEKGLPQYDVTSYHRFIITTNNPDPINISASNRRFWMTRCSDRRCKDTEYFKKMASYANDPLAMKSLYEYFKNHEGYGEGFSIENFNSNPMPTSEFQRNIQHANLPVPIQWLIHFAETKPELNDVTMRSSTVYNEFKLWHETSGLEFKINRIKFSLALVNDTNGMVTKGPKTMHGNTQIFHLQLVREKFGIESDYLANIDGLYTGSDCESSSTMFDGVI